MHTTAVIIGAGHAGLAMSRRLSERSIEHVVLERGEVANSWQTERWDSFRMLTPNWQATLPCRGYVGDHPDGYMTAAEVAQFIGAYAADIDAPVQTSTTVRALRQHGDAYEAITDSGTWCADAVVIASGPANIARLPDFAQALPADVVVHSALTYRRPDDLPESGVLVVGASATGLQLADEIHQSGRPVTLAVGEHVRMPRTYRGRDIFWWLDAVGVLDERHDQIEDLARARALPSPQLVGSDEGRSIDLDTLHRLGVAVVGRIGGIVDAVVKCSGGLANVCALADLKLARLLDRLDHWAASTGAAFSSPDRPAPTTVTSSALEVDLRRSGIGTVIFATGVRPDYSWLQIPALDRRGRIAHAGGVITSSPGAYVIGQSILRRRRSSYLSGATPDSADLVDDLHAYLNTRRALR
jgi:putative flavoprotein involved in K+ transport